jgi:hypothetical protein
MVSTSTTGRGRTDILYFYRGKVKKALEMLESPVHAGGTGGQDGPSTTRDLRSIGAMRCYRGAAMTALCGVRNAIVARWRIGNNRCTSVAYLPRIAVLE